MILDLIKEKMLNYANTQYKGDINNLITDKNIEFERIKDNNYLPKNYKYFKNDTRTKRLG